MTSKIVSIPGDLSSTVAAYRDDVIICLGFEWDGGSICDFARNPCIGYMFQLFRRMPHEEKNNHWVTICYDTVVWAGSGDISA